MRKSSRKSLATSLLALAVIGAGSSVLAAPARAATAARAFDGCDASICPTVPGYSLENVGCAPNASGGTNTTCTYI